MWWALVHAEEALMRSNYDKVWWNDVIGFCQETNGSLTCPTNGHLKIAAQELLQFASKERKRILWTIPQANRQHPTHACVFLQTTNANFFAGFSRNTSIGISMGTREGGHHPDGYAGAAANNTRDARNAHLALRMEAWRWGWQASTATNKSVLVRRLYPAVNLCNAQRILPEINFAESCWVCISIVAVLMRIRILIEKPAAVCWNIRNWSKII